MEKEFIYWRHPSPIGVKIEEISGGEDKSGKLWREMAAQIYSENGKGNFRELMHYASGAPLINGSDERISISHTERLMVVATLPETPELNLSQFSMQTALGIDTERRDRSKAMELRERFLNEMEMKNIVPNSVETNILAWTIKEAVYKAALTESVDFRKQIVIEKLPKPQDIEVWLEAYFKGEAKDAMPQLGSAIFLTQNGNEIQFNIYSYITEENYFVTVAYTNETTRFKK